MRRTALTLSLLAITFAFGAQAQEACPDIDGFVAEIFGNGLMKPTVSTPSIQWQRLDNPNLTLTWSPAKQKNVFRATADRLWNRVFTPAPAPAPQPTPMITTAASVFSIDPNLTQKHRASQQGFSVADLSLTYVDPRALSTLNASWETPWSGLIFAGTFRYAAGEADLRVARSFGKITLIGECNNCTNRTTPIISTDVATDGTFSPSMPRFFVVAARVAF